MLRGAAVGLSLAALVALGVGVLFGAVAGLATFSAALLLIHGLHLRQLRRLVTWTKTPLGTPPPGGTGAWEHVFAALGRLARQSLAARERLSYSLERVRAATEAMPDGLIYLNADGRIEWMNNRAEQHLGLNPSRDCGVVVTKLLREPEFVRFMRSGGTGAPLLMRSERRPGMTLLIQVVPFGDEQRMIVSRDVSKLERLETMRRDFVANVSHELRTPLTVVSGFVETILDGLDDFGRDETQRYLRLVLDQARRMEALIEDLLTLARLESGASMPVDEEVEAPLLVRSVAADARLLSDGRHDIAVEVDDGLLLRGSEKELRSAFANLASNAVRYTPAGGRIRLSWRETGEGAEFVVEDNGIGIEQQHIARLTERFYRADNGRSRETGGTGLGLAIVKHILTRHDAELHIDSEYGKGSRFRARFPKTRLARRTSSPARS